ncbi:hypothetical protein EYF80_011747 [Liparis tanakae]|uniref:Uncharacterized protein n=1 Tax=Liparis tanakae TaxID=230148 RepID=A0A4Z2IKH5_9TELE|nr:hypothetical protein EYF80_011747 [Liparis tanakae]
MSTKDQDYGNNGGLCTARASEETTPTHKTPPPLFPLTTGRSSLQSHPSNPLFTTLLVPDIIIPSFI